MKKASSKIVSSTKTIASIFLLLIGGAVAYTAINYSEYFPNGSQVVQSQLNGWTTPTGGASKDVDTPEGCRKITSTQGIAMFIPTRTTAEWNAFKNTLPSGVTISSCGSPVNGVCGAANGGSCLAVTTASFADDCAAGTAVNIGPRASDGMMEWTCQGLNGGSSVACSGTSSPVVCANELECASGYRSLFSFNTGIATYTAKFTCQYPTTTTTQYTWNSTTLNWQFVSSNTTGGGAKPAPCNEQC